MRKVKALEVLAAATIAAIPTIGFADDGAVMRPRPQGVDRPAGNPFVFNFNQVSTGKYTFVRPGVTGGPEVDGTFTWNGPNNGTWQTAANWLPNSGFPDGSAATAVINNLNGGGVVQLTGGITLSNLNLTDPQIAAIAGPTSGASVTMTMAGNRTISAGQLSLEKFPFTPTFFGASIGLPAVAPDPARPVVIGGSNGLIVDGLGAAGLGDSGKISIRFSNPYTGNTTIQNGGQVTLLNQVSMDGAFGGGTDITLNRGKIWVEVDNGTLNKTITVQGLNNNLALGTDPANAGTSTQTFNGNIGGSGRLQIDGDFGGIGNFTANNTYSGILDVSIGSQVLSGNGAFASVSALNNSGSLTLEGGGVNRLSDTSTLTMYGASLRMNNYNGTETLGGFTIRGGTSNIIMQGGSGSLNGGAITRQNNGGLEIQANGLGSTNKIFFSNGTSQLVSGVFKYAFGHDQDPFVNGISSQFTQLMTYNANGMVTLGAAGGYAENVYTPGADVRLQSDVVDEAFPVPAGTTTINSLTMAPGFDGGGNGVNGVHVNGTGVLNISSGMVLSSFDGFTPGNAINSGVGNVVEANVTIQTPTDEMVLACPGAMTFQGTLADAPGATQTGMTKVGIRTLFMNSTTNTYEGATVLSGFNRHKGNLPNNAPSAYGSSSSAIILDPNNRIQNDPGLGNTGIFGVSFGPDANSGATTMDRPLVVRGNEGRGQVISQIRNFSNGGFTMNGAITVELGANLAFVSLNGAATPYTINSIISGPGIVSAQQLQASLFMALNAQNTFSGGFDLAGGLVTVGANTTVGAGDAVISGPFGTGLISVSGATFNGMDSTTGARTVGNDLLLNNGSFQVAGTNPFTFSGNVIAAGALLDIVPGNSATFSGVLSGSDMFKTGSGVLNLTGNNTIDGQINAGNGTVEGGMIVMRSNNAPGSGVGASAANFGENAIAVSGTGLVVGSDELMVVRGEGIGGLGNLRNLSGSNTWNGSVLVQEQTGLTTKGSIGVDGAGDTMSITGSIFTSGTNTSGSLAVNLGVRKVGPGTLVVGADNFVGTGSTTFKGSVIASGSIEVAQGTVRMSNTFADTHTPSVADVPSVTIAGGPGAATAKLDLGKNALVVDYTGASPLADIRSFIVQGYAAGSWTGNGITSSDANASNFAVGYAENAGGSGTSYTTFFGDPVDNTSVLAVWTRYGDANLDNLVNLGDFNRLASNFGTAAGAVWSQGDFDYNGNVNLGDFNRLAANFGLTASPGGPTPADWSALSAAVPEPSTLGLAAVAGIGLLQRRRRNAR